MPGSNHAKSEGFYFRWTTFGDNFAYLAYKRDTTHIHGLFKYITNVYKYKYIQFWQIQILKTLGLHKYIAQISVKLYSNVTEDFKYKYYLPSNLHKK